jgi:hypothetical protein
MKVWLVRSLKICMGLFQIWWLTCGSWLLCWIYLWVQHSCDCNSEILLSASILCDWIKIGWLEISLSLLLIIVNGWCDFASVLAVKFSFRLVKEPFACWCSLQGVAVRDYLTVGSLNHSPIIELWLLLASVHTFFMGGCLLGLTKVRSTCFYISILYYSLEMTYTFGWIVSLE